MKEGRRKALSKLLPLQKKDFEGIFRAMDGHAVTIRLLDPPLHEFVPHDEKGQMEMAKVMGISYRDIHDRVEGLMEANRCSVCAVVVWETSILKSPRCRQLIMEGVIELKKEGIKAKPEIMVPLTGIVHEFKAQKDIIENTIQQVFAEQNASVKYKIEP